MAYTGWHYNIGQCFTHSILELKKTKQKNYFYLKKRKEKRNHAQKCSTHMVLCLDHLSVLEVAVQPVEDPRGRVTDEWPGGYALLLHEEHGVLQHQLRGRQVLNVQSHHIKLE